jgi:hypothetical protein
VGRDLACLDLGEMIEVLVGCRDGDGSPGTSTVAALCRLRQGFVPGLKIDQELTNA